MNKWKEVLILSIITAVFLLLRLPGIHIPLHQDEYKWSFIIDSSGMQVENEIPHPPVGEFLYRSLFKFTHQNNLRLIPIIFSFLNLFLIYYLAKITISHKAAFWTAILFTASFFSVLASLMIDTDGTFMPFFALLSFIFYHKYRESNKNIFLLPLLAALVLGFLIKVSFGLVPLAIAIDFAIDKGIFTDKKRFLKYCFYGLLLVVAMALLLFLSKFIFPFFDLAYSIKYWEHFINFGSRAWFQTLIQVIKSLLFASPLLILPLLFVDRSLFQKTRVLFLFIITGLFFYVLFFDFSIGALDRYLQFLIVPLSIISASVFASFINCKDKNYTKYIIPPLLLSVVLFFVQFFHHSVPPLYPKTEWIERALSLKWNFLFPFVGGSGPLPFYVSFVFIALVWIICTVLIIFALKKKELKEYVLIGVLIFGSIYNGVFIEEYVYGKINGNTGSLIKNAAKFIVENRDIKKVTVYNDNGGNEIVRSGKYRKRLYVDPKFDINEKIKNLNLYKEHYLVVDIPHLDEKSVYAKYFDTCEIVYTETSKKIKATIYDCKNAPDIKYDPNQ